MRLLDLVDFEISRCEVKADALNREDYILMQIDCVNLSGRHRPRWPGVTPIVSEEQI